jgi:hypothetical protein
MIYNLYNRWRARRIRYTILPPHYIASVSPLPGFCSSAASSTALLKPPISSGPVCRGLALEKGGYPARPSSTSSRGWRVGFFRWGERFQG